MKSLPGEGASQKHALSVGQVCNGENAAARPAVGCVQEHLYIQGSAAQPRLERGRSDKTVDTHGKVQPILGRKEGIYLENPKLLKRRVLELDDEVRERHVMAFTPRVIDNGADQDVLAAANGISLDADEAEESRRDALDFLLCLFLTKVPCRPAEALKD